MEDDFVAVVNAGTRVVLICVGREIGATVVVTLSDDTSGILTFSVGAESASVRPARRGSESVGDVAVVVVVRSDETPGS
jgi:hypothetical protein